MVRAPIAGMAWRVPFHDQAWSRLLRGEHSFRAEPSNGRLRNALVARMPSAGTPAAKAMDLAMEAASEAMAEAGIPSVAALVLGSSAGAWLESPSLALKDWAEAMGTSLGASIRIAVSTACSSGADAIGVGLELFRAGIEPVLCVAADLATDTKRMAHSALATMTSSIPQPFGRGRDGMLLGDGGAAVVLGGARTHGAVLGVGWSNDAYAATAPDPKGLGVRLAVRRALRDAGVEAKAISVIHAHGSGTEQSDSVEASAILDLFQHHPIVFGTKSALGHSLGATGLVETVALLRALEGGVAPPTLGARDLDPACSIAVSDRPQAIRGQGFGLNLTLGFGGFNSAVVVDASGSSLAPGADVKKKDED